MAPAMTDGAGVEPADLDRLRWVTGRILDPIRPGDHVGYLLEPLATGGDGKGPFLTFQDVRNLRAGHEA